MQIGHLEILKFLDLNLTIDSNKKNWADFYAKPTNGFTYVLSSASYNKKKHK